MVVCSLTVGRVWKALAPGALREAKPIAHKQQIGSLITQSSALHIHRTCLGSHNGHEGVLWRHVVSSSGRPVCSLKHVLCVIPHLAHQARKIELCCEAHMETGMASHGIICSWTRRSWLLPTHLAAGLCLVEGSAAAQVHHVVNLDVYCWFQVSDPGDYCCICQSANKLQLQV